MQCNASMHWMGQRQVNLTP